MTKCIKPRQLGSLRVRIRRLVLLAAAVGGLAAPVLLPASVRADGPLIQPGAAVQLSGGAFGKPCTLSFVFRDSGSTYIGATARCAAEVGERASWADREFGTVVFRTLSISTLEESITHTESIDDFALIRVDDSELHRVSPVVLDVGRAPRGVTTADRTKEGDQMSMTGQGTPYRDGPMRHRVGALISDDSRGFHLAIPASLGDGGSPVLDANFNAYGVLASSLNLMGPYGTTIERIEHLLDRAGFHVELVTA